MKRTRTLVMFFLFTAAGLIIVYVGVSTIFDFVAITKTRVEPARYAYFLICISAFFFAALILVREAAAKFLIWAAQHENRRILWLFQRIAPRFSRKILSSIVGTSIALSSAVVANAVEVAPAASLPNSIYAQSKSLPEATEANQRTVPNAQWFPEQVSVPLNRLVSSSAQPKRQPRRTASEVVVAPGENLWSIAASRLGSQATAEEISVYWPQIYQANEQVIGSDPNLLEVGTVLVLPPMK